MQKEEEEYIVMILFNLPGVEEPNSEDNTAPLHPFPVDHQNMQKALISLFGVTDNVWDLSAVF